LIRAFLQEAVFDEILKGIDFENYSIDLLVARVAKYRGISIILVPQPMQGLTEYGYWLKGQVHDYIFFDCATARVHQDHIIMHELGHILLGHETYRVTAESTAKDALCLMRSINRDCREERDAEGFAIALQHEIVRRMGLKALIANEGSTRSWTDLMNNLT
jgi:hypothetical protein